MNDSLIQMRGYIMVMEHLLQAEFDQPEGLIEVAPAPEPDARLIEKINDIVFKLRSFTESSSEGETAFGIEMGMQRAADMIENVINQLKDSNG